MTLVWVIYTDFLLNVKVLLRTGKRSFLISRPLFRLCFTRILLFIVIFRVWVKLSGWKRDGYKVFFVLNQAVPLCLLNRKDLYFCEIFKNLGGM